MLYILDLSNPSEIQKLEAKEKKNTIL